MKLSTLLFAVPALAQDASNTVILEEPSHEPATFTALPSWSDGVTQLPNIYNTTAVDANEAGNGYRLVNVSKSEKGLNGILKIRGQPKNIYGYDFDTLNLTVTYQSEDRLNVRIQPTNLTDVFILPEDILRRPSANEQVDIADSDLLFEYDTDNFGFAVIRKSTGEALFDTRGNPLVFENQFVQLNTSLPRGHVISGLGDVAGDLEIKPNTTRTMITTDNQTPPGKSLYGIYPAYYDQRYDTNTTHAVWWRTSAIQEVRIGDTDLTWRTLSGIVDLFFFAGPTPKKAISQYINAIGLPTMQQYFLFGFHQCRWGYRDLDELKQVRENFKNANIPVETWWNDLDYMDRYLDFTIGDAFKDIGDFIDELHEDGNHYVPLLDAGIYIPGKNTSFYPNYTAYHEGHDLDVFLKDGSTLDEYVGEVWPGFVVFPDWMHNNTQGWWSEQVLNWYEKMNFDGLWNDMNEPSSYVMGSIPMDIVDSITGPMDAADPWGLPTNMYPRGINITNKSFAHANITHEPIIPPNYTNMSTTWEQAENYKLPGKGNILHPPYAVDYYQEEYDIGFHHVAPDAVHANGFLEYELEGIFGHMMSNASYHALLATQPTKRPFVLTRSASAGSGNWTAKWGGDNFADWFWMAHSIQQYMQTASVGGIPFYGVDACGFNGNTDMELCARWMQLASFFPFMRSHNTLGAHPQEAYLWADVAEATRQSLHMRYLLLPYHYTLLNEAHNTGMPLLRHQRWLFPNDKSYAFNDNQFFLGDWLLVTPVLQPNTSTVVGDFPGAGTTEVYYDWYTHEQKNFTSHNQTLHAPLGYIPVHFRGGGILPTQEPAEVTRDSRKNPFGLIAALDKNGQAVGELYLDDGESLVQNATLTVNFIAGNNRLTAVPFGTYNESQPLANVTVLGVQSKPKQVKFSNTTVGFDYTNQTLFITGLQNLTTAGAWSKQFTVSWE